MTAYAVEHPYLAFALVVLCIYVVESQFVNVLRLIVAWKNVKIENEHKKEAQG